MKAVLVSHLLPRFFSEHLRQHRNLSPHTLKAYRDSFTLLLRFLKKTCRTAPASLELRSLNPERVLAFLTHLERHRGNGIRSRNVRLAAIRSFVHYAEDLLGPEMPESTRRVLAIPAKRHTRPVLGFLNHAEVEGILRAAVDSWTGRRDHLLFLLLYNTGARVSEILSLRVHDALKTDCCHLCLHGKGRKERVVPLWRNTQRELRRWIKENHLTPEVPLLANRFGHPLTRSGVAWQLRQMTRKAAKVLPSLAQRTITPHTFRHTNAMHLLQGGVAPEVIALWLGHESPNTTHLYVEADLDMKRKAMETLVPPKTKSFSAREQDEVLRFLESL